MGGHHRYRLGSRRACGARRNRSVATAERLAEMKKTEIVKALRPWKESYAALQKCTDSAQALFGGAVAEGSLIDGYCKAFSGWTSSLSTVVGDTDRWLEWFAWENDMGAKRFEVHVPGWSKPRPVRSLEDLADVILACAKIPATTPRS